MLRTAGFALMTLILASCAAPTIKSPSDAHLGADAAKAGDAVPGTIPAPVLQNIMPPRPKPSAAGKTETYSVVVNNVPAHDLLFALARDAKLNIDVHPGIEGNVTLNAIDQTLPQLLNRIARQVDMRYELDGPNLAIMPDSPFLRTYRIDYVNMSRDTTGAVAVTTQVASGAQGTGDGGGGTVMSSSGANNSITRVENKSQNRFWETIVRNVREILYETDKILPDGSTETVVEKTEQSTIRGSTPPAQTERGGRTPRASRTTRASSATGVNLAAAENSGTTVVRHSTFREAASVIAHPESGILSVRATARQHEKIQEFLGKVMESVKRQVLIEATIAEVSLSNEYQQGIDWSVAPLGRTGFTIVQQATGSISAPVSSLLQLSYNNQNSRIGAIKSAITLLEGFGTVKVLSSPKLSVMNNQTAVMKVVDNNVYFTLKADTTANTNTSVTTFTTTLQSVPVGFVMNVTPQIGANDSVMLNVRPSISSIADYVTDPNPTLANPCGFGVADCSIPPIQSRIPVVRTREMESVIRVENGNIAVMGGLIEDKVQNVDNTVPGISRIPLLGEFFKQRQDVAKKTELVIFLRPIVIKDASLDGDYADLKRLLPQPGFFDEQPGNPGSSPIYRGLGGAHGG